MYVILTRCFYKMIICNLLEPTNKYYYTNPLTFSFFSPFGSGTAQLTIIHSLFQISGNVFAKVLFAIIASLCVLKSKKQNPLLLVFVRKSGKKTTLCSPDVHWFTASNNYKKYSSLRKHKIWSLSCRDKKSTKNTLPWAEILAFE